MKFQELTTQERIDQLVREGSLGEREASVLAEGPGLPTAMAANMIENQVGAFPVPLGIARNFIIDGRPTSVPLAVEEPSVIAAAGNAAKRCRDTGGFVTSVERGGLIGQVVFLGHLERPEAFLEAHLDSIRKVSRDAHPSLEEHGGGLRDVCVVTYPEADIVEFRLTINPGEAMGANVVNTISEAVGRYIERASSQLRLLMAILSNSAPLQRARATARFPFSQLPASGMEGSLVAQRIVQAGRFAQLSPQRAVTQNKGIMNGVDALVLATGNDTRNVAAAAYAALNEHHRTWTQWDVQNDCLVGVIDIPMPIGAVGGAISTLPVAKTAMRILADPDAERLMGIAASVGLASNMAALRALVTRGIQAGHMNLQLRSLAMMAGARETSQIERVVSVLSQDVTHADLSRAKAVLADDMTGLRWERA